MHETGIVRDLVRHLEMAALDAGAERVVSATVWLGALSQFSAEHFREHFYLEAKDGVAEGATVTIEQSDDAGDPHAQDIMIKSIELEVSEAES